MQLFWSKLVSIMNEILHANFPVCPVLCLLDQVSTSRLFMLGCPLAKRIILMIGKECKPCCFAVSNWLEDYLDLVNTERPAALLKD